MNLKLDFWKASPNGGGAAAIFDYNPEKQKLFLSMRGQLGTDKAFEKDKSKHVVASLDIPDIGEMMLVLSGRINGLGKEDNGKFKGLYHTFGEKEDGNNTIISLSLAERGFYLGLSTRRGTVSGRHSIMITFGEAEVLRLFLERVLADLFVNTWNGDRQETGSTNDGPSRADPAPTPPTANKTVAKASPKATVTKKPTAKQPDPAPNAIGIEEEVPF